MSSSAPALVLVHGAWGGGWVWRRVVAPLREAGFEVHTVTLTGDGRGQRHVTGQLGDRHLGDLAVDEKHQVHTLLAASGVGGLLEQRGGVGQRGRRGLGLRATGDQEHPGHHGGE